jgi:tRNA A-37 threonylcarbamoyl transferase component Bud32
MNEESSQKSCPKCNSIIAPDAPGGLCPHCLMQFVAMSTGGADFPATDRSPPNIETIQAAFPQLEILDLIGQGGMGAVYKARQPKLDRIVALKILPLRLAREPLFAERFEREGRLLARLNHPNIVGVYDFGQTDGHYYLIMEYVDGVNLRQAFASARFTPQQALSVIPKICEALQFAHDEGVLHRDIKPENILLDTKGRVKIADFGIAKFSGVDDKTGLTATGATIGTPHYMAPEQVEQPANVDHRADIFSLGVVFYEMLTGELPLGRFSAPSERTKSLDARIDSVVMRALEKDRERRQQSANEVRTQVEMLSSNTAPHAMQSHLALPKPPVVSSVVTNPNYSARPTLAIALTAVSLFLPIAVALQYDGPNSGLVFWLGMLAAWFGIPGIVLGVRHLVYLGQSGNRHGLKRAVVASTFWLGVSFVGWTLPISDRIMAKSLTAPADMFLGSLVALIAGVSLSVFGIWMIKKWIERMPPNPNYLASTVKGDVASAVNFLLKAVAMAIWAFFGLIIVYMTPGAPSQKQTVVLLDTQTVPIPELELQIDSVSTKENVLIVVIKNRNPSMVGSPSMGMGMGMGMPAGGEMGTGEGGGGFGMGNTSEMEVESAVQLQVDFYGEILPAEAQVLATESHAEKCLFPGEPSEIVTLSEKGTLALAFAFPNSATAIACMNKIRREQARVNQGMGMGMGMGVHSIANGQLFSINGVFGLLDYEAHVKAVP